MYALESLKYLSKIERKAWVSGTTQKIGRCGYIMGSEGIIMSIKNLSITRTDMGMYVCVQLIENKGVSVLALMEMIKELRLQIKRLARATCILHFICLDRLFSL